MHPATTDQVADLRQRIHELELKMIRVSGQEARHEVSLSGMEARHKMSLSGLEARHESWRSLFMDMMGIMMVVVSFLFTFLAVAVRHSH
jgi:hypothetical protein